MTQLDRNEKMEGEPSHYTQVIKIAYLIMVHRFPNQFMRLFEAIYDESNVYLIHVDQKASPDTFRQISLLSAKYENVDLLERQQVTWGGYSMVQTELNGMQYLISNYKDWDYFVNLSGQDFPLLSQSQIRNFLAQNQGKNFIKTVDQRKGRPETLNRIISYYVESTDHLSKIFMSRPYLSNAIPYIGGQWMILTRSCCEFIFSSTEVKRFQDFYINTLIADESFFQTVFMNTSFSEEIVNDDKRAIIWVPQGDIKLRPKTLTLSDLDFLLGGGNLFARKFDETVDSDILDLLEQHIQDSSDLKNKNSPVYALQ